MSTGGRARPEEEAGAVRSREPTAWAAGGGNSLIARLSDMISAINARIGAALPSEANPPIPVEVVQPANAVDLLQSLVLPLVSPVATTGLVIVLVIFILLERDNLGFVVAYVAVGSVFAGLIFAVCVVAMPMILDRETDAITAGLTSLRLCLTQPGVMLLWGAAVRLLRARREGAAPLASKPIGKSIGRWQRRESKLNQ